jgi:hypothetical protein
MLLVIHRRRTIATIEDRKLTWNTILSSSGVLAKAIRSSKFDSSGGVNYTVRGRWLLRPK